MISPNSLSSLCRNVGPGLGNHLWQSTVVVLLVWLLTLALRHNQARTRYVLWMAASVKFVVPFSLFVAMGAWLGPGAAAIESQQLAATAGEIALPFRQSSAVETPGMWNVDPISASPHGDWLPAALLALWLCGFLFVMLRWMRGWREIRAILRSACPSSITLKVPVFLSPYPVEPGVFGIWRPVLLLPERIVKELSAPQLLSIVSHETSHIRRRDNLTSAIHMVVEAVFWFHPAVWWIEAHLIEERELACDDTVLQMGNDAIVYAESILNVCKFYTGSPLACMSRVTGSDLKRRIVRIVTKQTGHRLDLSRKLLLGAAGAMAVALPFAFGLVHVTQVRAQAAPASNIAGTWQGTLHTTRDLRFVIKITKAADAPLRATFYNIDGEPGGIPVISATLNGFSLKLELGFASYQGTASPDGNTITGMWLQGSNSSRLDFARATQSTEWTIPEPPPQLPAMAADANPAFEVATIKLSRSDEHGPRYNFQNSRFSVVHTSLSDLLKFSYRLQQSQIASKQDWVNSDSYDISAEANGEGAPSISQWQTMVGKLLADRFQLRFHFEKREQSVYLLTVAKNGPKLMSSESVGDQPGGMGFGPPGNFGATNQTMADIANALGQGVLNRPVVDQTGLSGRYNLRLKWAGDEPPNSTDTSNASSDFFTAIQEQWGLKVVSTKAPVDVLVIDRVERPSEN